MEPDAVDRRTFVAALGSCTAHLFFTLGAATAGARRLFAAPRGNPVIGREPWGRLEKLTEGAWALISTPLAGGPDAMRTISNGGIIAGREGVAVVEGLGSEQGARWLADAALELTGRWPTHVILTHYHSDHSNGLAAFRTEGRTPLYYSTTKTREDLVASVRDRDRPSSAVATLRAERVTLVDAEAVTLDLGGRRLRIVPRAGHTRSDLVVILEDPHLVWCGDLVWNGLFPNYIDARPSELSRHVRALRGEPAERWVPGHGSLADAGALDVYLALLDDVEAAARRGLEAGRPVEVIARDYHPPAGLGEWVLFSPRYYETAFRAWARELGGGATE
ncbi:MAG TPA: MBL fold metallo-hydrolase [Longimicrobiales bacterium]